MSVTVRQFLEHFAEWASSQVNILAVALVGSHARNEATNASDVDLVVIATAHETYIENTKWAEQFGTITRQQREDYGRVTSLRVWYAGGPEVEYGFTDETWPALPVDDGTQAVISGGMAILLERANMLSRIS